MWRHEIEGGVEGLARQAQVAGGTRTGKYFLNGNGKGHLLEALGNLHVFFWTNHISEPSIEGILVFFWAPQNVVYLGPRPVAFAFVLGGGRSS